MSVDRLPRDPQYRLYIDESGDHAYKNLETPTLRYLALAGVWFRSQDCYVQFADDLERFKREIFGPRPDNPIILHREDIINTRGPFEILRQATTREKFNAGLLRVIQQARFSLIIVIIDKLEHKRRYTQPDHPYHYCLGAMLDRYCGWLKYHGGCGDVMAEARGAKEDRLLDEEYRRIYEKGTRMIPRPRDHHQIALTSGKIKLRRKLENVAGLQLADLLAHPLKQRVLCERGALSTLRDTFGELLCTAVKDKYNMNYSTEQVEGYGKVWLPTRK